MRLARRCRSPLAHKLCASSPRSCAISRCSSPGPRRGTKPRGECNGIGTCGIIGDAAVSLRRSIRRARLVLYAVSARETVRGYSGREDFWFIVAIRSEDEAEIRAGETAGGSGREGPPACDAPAVLGRGEDPHRARGPAG